LSDAGFKKIISHTKKLKRLFFLNPKRAQHSNVDQLDYFLQVWVYSLNAYGQAK